MINNRTYDEKSDQQSSMEEKNNSTVKESAYKVAAGIAYQLGGNTLIIFSAVLAALIVPLYFSMKKAKLIKAGNMSMEIQ